MKTRDIIITISSIVLIIIPVAYVMNSNASVNFIGATDSRSEALYGNPSVASDDLFSVSVRKIMINQIIEMPHKKWGDAIKEDNANMERWSKEITQLEQIAIDEPEFKKVTDDCQVCTKWFMRGAESCTKPTIGYSANNGTHHIDNNSCTVIENEN